MKKYCLFLAAILVFLWAATSYALVEVEVLPQTTFARSTGEPFTETVTFPGVEGLATVKLWNGNLEDTSVEKVSSSTITVNGEVVLGPSNFNQNVVSLEGQATLKDSSVEGPNTLEVCLKGKPGGQVTIQVIQTVEAEGAAFIGSDGGVVEVTDPESELYGASPSFLVMKAASCFG